MKKVLLVADNNCESHDRMSALQQLRIEAALCPKDLGLGYLREVLDVDVYDAVVVYPVWDSDALADLLDSYTRMGGIVIVTTSKNGPRPGSASLVLELPISDRELAVSVKGKLNFIFA